VQVKRALLPGFGPAEWPEVSLNVLVLGFLHASMNRGEAEAALAEKLRVLVTDLCISLEDEEMRSSRYCVSYCSMATSILGFGRETVRFVTPWRIDGEMARHMTGFSFGFVCKFKTKYA
jgi:hypothetical protein